MLYSVLLYALLKIKAQCQAIAAIFFQFIDQESIVFARIFIVFRDKVNMKKCFNCFHTYTKTGSCREQFNIST